MGHLKGEYTFILSAAGGIYMSAGMLGAWLYFMPIRWNACSRVTYMSAGTLGAWLYFMAVHWHACSGATYMPAGMLGAPPNISGPICYMHCKDIILAEIG